MSDFTISAEFLEQENLLHELSPKEAINMASDTEKNVIFTHANKLYVCRFEPESEVIEINLKDLINTLKTPQKDVSDFLANLGIVGEISTKSTHADTTDLYLPLFLEAKKILGNNKNSAKMQELLIKKRLDHALLTLNSLIQTAENERNFEHSTPLLSNKEREDLSNSLVRSMIDNSYQINGELLEHDIEKANMFFSDAITSRCKRLGINISNVIRICYEREKYTFDTTLGFKKEEIKQLETFLSHPSLLKPCPPILPAAPIFLSRDERNSTDYQSCLVSLKELSQINTEHPDDLKMRQFITEKNSELSANMTNLRQVKALKFSLKTLMESPVTRIILDRVTELKSSWFSRFNGKRRKANAILEAFYNIPVSDRPYLFTGKTKEIIACQEAMSVSRGPFENKPKPLKNNASLKKVRDSFHATKRAIVDVDLNCLPWEQPEPEPISYETKELNLNINILQNSLGDFMAFLAEITPTTSEKAALNSCCDMMNDIGNRDIKTDDQYQLALSEYAAVRDFFSTNISSVTIVADAHISSNLLSVSKLPAVNAEEDNFHEDSEKSFSNQSRNSRSEDDSDNESSISY